MMYYHYTIVLLDDPRQQTSETQKSPNLPIKFLPQPTTLWQALDKVLCDIISSGPHNNLLW